MKYKFLTEQPVTDDLKFGHKEILDTLQSIVTTCGTPFTIGLFGKWGSGKSSIAESLRTKLLQKSQGIPVILFDVWKHEGDALRRTFLKELVKQLHSSPYGDDFFKPKFKLKDTVQTSRQTSSTQTISFDLKVILPLLKPFAIAVVLLIILTVLYLIVRECLLPIEPIITNAINSIFTVGTIITFIGWLFINLKEFANKTDVTISEDRIADPHEFEEEFKRVLENLSNGRIIIIFDNLDRVSGESALEIISTIKTFLEPADKAIERKEVVFLLPCDVEAIKKHLIKVLQPGVKSNPDNSENYADEFLRKFFNTILWIPEFYSIELEQYATEKLKETKIEEFNNDHLAWLIIQVFKNNPRQIIQFINTLISNYILLANKSRQNAFGDINFYKSNIVQLAKYLLLIQRFPLIMEKYKKTKTYDLNDHNPLEDLQGIHDFKQFLAHTSDIVILSLEPFFNFKLSEQEKAIPGASKLLDLLQNGQNKEAIQFSTDLAIHQKVDQFSRIVDNYLTSKSNSIIICSFLNSLFNLTNHLKITLRPNSYREIQKHFESSPVVNIERIRPVLLVSEFLSKHETTTFRLTINTKTKLVTRWVSILVETKASREATPLTRNYEVELNINLLDHISHLPSNSLREYHGIIRAHYAQDLELCSLIISHPESKTVCIPEFIQAIIQHISISSEEELNHFTEVTKLLKQVDSGIISRLDGIPILIEMTNLINTQLISKVIDQRSPILEHLKNFIELLLTPIAKVTDLNILNAFSTALTTTSNQAPRNLLCHYVLIFDILQPADKESFNHHGRMVFMKFFNGLQDAGEENTEYVLRSMKDPAKIIEKPDHLPHLNNLIIQSEAFFRILYRYANSIRRYSWLIQLIQGHRFRWLLDNITLINEFEIIDKPEIFRSTVARLQTITEKNHTEDAVNFLQEINILITEVDPSPLHQVIINQIQSTGLKKTGLSAFQTSKFVDDEGRLRIAEKLVDGLSGTPYNQAVLTAIKQSYHVLDSDKQRLFFTTIFDRLLLNPQKASWMEPCAGLFIELGIQLGNPELNLLKQRAEEYFNRGDHEKREILIKTVYSVIANNLTGHSSDHQAWFEQEFKLLSFP